MNTHYANISPYITKDGSEIRELMHPSVHGNANQSLAEATIFPGHRTQCHRHAVTEEIYHITAGRGQLTLDDTQHEINPGDTVLIPPGTRHCVVALGTEPLRILCACSPAYSHEDTELLGSIP